MRSHTTVKRLTAIGVAGSACLLSILSYQYAHRLRPAPEAVQESGLAIIHTELAKLKVSVFGQTERGQRITAEVNRLLAENRVAFAPMMTMRGLTWDPVLGRQTIYIKVIPLTGGTFLHQQPQQIMEALVHEAVHCIKDTRWRISIEEECDCFAAGIEAAYEAAAQRPQGVITIDGRSVADFVASTYPKATRSAGYEPVGESREWLARRTGLPQVDNTQP
jgi:hypothetical protein